MGKILSNFFSFFKMTDDIDDEEDDDEEEFSSENRFSGRERISSRKTNLREDSDEYQRSLFSGSKNKMTEDKKSKVVPYNKKNFGATTHQVSILSPKNIKEACKACDYLAEGKAVVLNLEGISEAEAQRIMDFVFGCMYAINGEYSQISSYIFIFVSQSGELLSDFEESVKSFSLENFSSQSGEFEIPVIKRDF